MEAPVLFLILNAAAAAITNNYVAWTDLPDLRQSPANRLLYAGIVLLGLPGIWLWWRLCRLYRTEMRAWSSLGGLQLQPGGY